MSNMSHSNQNGSSDTVSLSDGCPTFRISVIFPSSRVEDLMIWHILPLKMSPRRHIET